jgi:hypothetical protein
MMKTLPLTKCIAEIKQILATARQKAYSAVNFAMVEAYWLIGKRIVEEEQHGNNRAEYGKQVIKELSHALTAEFGKGFSERSLWQYRQFYQTFSDSTIMRAPLAQFDNVDNEHNAILRSPLAESSFTTYFSKLNWTHIQRIMRVSNPDARVYYLKEAAEQMWSSRISAYRRRIKKRNRTSKKYISTKQYQTIII